MARKTLPLFFFFLLSIVACGGQRQITQDNPVSRATPTPVPVTITADSVFNMSMLGQTWDFINGFGDSCTTFIESAAPLQRTNPDGTVTTVTYTDPNGDVAGRGGNNLVMHEIQNGHDRCWNGIHIHNAEVWFPLHQNPDGSWRSISAMINFPSGCPWCGPDGKPGTDPFLGSFQVIDTQSGMPFPYMIAPPTVTSGQILTFETRVCSSGPLSLTFDNVIPATHPLCGPADGEYWRTDFYIENVDTPAYSGPAIVSDQREGNCGHERWFFAPGKGIVKIESPYDGGQTNDPHCMEWQPNSGDHAVVNDVVVHDARFELVRVN